MAYEIINFDGGSLPVSVTNPYGALDDGATIVNAKSNNDMQVFFQKMMAGAGITPNNLPDNSVNTFQLFKAFSGTWTLPTFSGTYIADGTNPIMYKKEMGGTVLRIRGVTDNSAHAVVVTASFVFTLPVGFRPLTQCTFPVVNAFGSAVIGAITVRTNGDVVIEGGFFNIDNKGVRIDVSMALD